MSVTIADTTESSGGELAWLLGAELEAEPPVDEIERFLVMADRVLEADESRHD